MKETFRPKSLWCLILAATLFIAERSGAAYEPYPLGDTSRRWAVSLSTRTGWDDNVDNRQNNKQSTAVGVLEPQLYANLPLEQTFVGLRYTYNATYYVDRPGEQLNQSHTADILFSHTFTPRLVLDMRDGMRRGIEPELVEQSAGVPIITRRRGDFFYNSASGKISYNLTRRWVASLSGSWEYWSFDEATVADDNDRQTYQSTLSGVFAINRTTFVGANYEYGKTEYVEPGTGGARDTESHTGYFSFVRQFSPQLSLRGSAGATLSEFGDGTQSTTPAVVGSATYNYGPASAVTGGFRYSISTTEVATFRSSDTASVFAQVAHRITPKFSASAYATYVLSTFQNPLPTSRFSAGVEETAIQVTLGLTYRFTRWFGADLNYTHDRVTSDVGGRSFDRNRVSAGLRLSY